MKRIIRSIFVGAVLLTAAPVGAGAAVFQEPTTGQTLPSELFEQGYSGDWVRSARLKAVVDLLEAGKRDEAKIELAIYMKEVGDNAQALELASVLLIEDGKYDTALQALTKSIMLEPRRVSAIVKLGVVLILQGKREGAQIAFNKALEFDPGAPLALRYLAFLEQTRGRPYAVIDLLQRLLTTGWVGEERVTEVHLVLAESYNIVEAYEGTRQLLEPMILGRGLPDPNASGAWFLYNALIELEDAKAAKEVLSILRVQHGADDPGIALAEASYARLSGDTDAAEKRLRNLIATSPEQAASARYQLALIYRANEDWNGAARELEAAAELADADDIGTVMSELSGALINAGKADRAIDLLDRYALRFPNVPAVAYLKAEVEAQRGNLGDARRQLRNITEFHTSFSTAFYLLGVVEWQLGDVKAARAALRQAVTIDPNDVQYWLVLTGMYDAHQVSTVQKSAEQAHDHGAANPMVAVLDEALKANPGHPELVYERASLAYSDGDAETAQKLYREVLQRAPNHVAAINNLALSILQSSDDTEEAGKLINRARRLAPQNPAVLDTFGWYLLRTGRTDDAIEVLEAVAKAVPDDAMVQYHLGVTYLQADRIADAATLIDAALAHGLPALEAAQAEAVKTEIARRRGKG